MNPQNSNPAMDAAAMQNGQHMPNPALADLKDIIPPDPIGAWPWAIGYWLVLAILLGLIVFGIIYFIKRAKYLAPKKTAITLLTQLDSTASNYPSEVNSLLKRTALSYLPREVIAGLDGAKWANWLDSHLPQAQRGRIGALLDKRHQAAPLTIEEAKELQQLALSWLKAKAKFNTPISLGSPLQHKEAV